MSANLITWTCAHCHRPIADGSGCINLTRTGLSEYADAVKALAAAHPGRFMGVAFLQGKLAAVPWKPLHFRCDPTPEDEHYSIDVERFRSLADLTQWVDHLTAKRWIDATAFDDVLYAAGVQIIDVMATVETPEPVTA